MKLNNLLKPISILVFVIGVVVLVFGYSINNSNIVNRDVKITYIQKAVFANGSQLKNTRRIFRLLKSDGSWKETTIELNEDGSTRKEFVQYAINGRGVFRVDEKNKRLLFIGDRPAQIPVYSAEAARNRPNFIGENSVLGYKTIVTRDRLDESSYMKIHSSVDFNGLRLKWIDMNDNVANIFEATDIRVERITDEEFGSMPNYPVDNSFYKKTY